MSLFNRMRTKEPKSRGYTDGSFAYNGTPYSLVFGGDPHKIPSNFQALTSNGLQGDAVVYACIQTRMYLFGDLVFQWRNFEGDLFGTDELSILENPWPGGSTSQLAVLAEQDVSLAGNFFAYRTEADTIIRLRPDWVELVGDPTQPVPTGYIYSPDGDRENAQFLDPENVVHWKPIPDPINQWRGMSWLTPVLRELDADIRMTEYKNRFLDNAATPNLLIKYRDQLGPEVLERIEEKFTQTHGGVSNAFKTMVLDTGADVDVVGSDLSALNYVQVQAAGENRICAASGIPAVIVGLKEGMQAATYSNVKQAFRRTLDVWARPQWRSFCEALQNVLTVPPDSNLWYDDRQIAAAQQDEMDQADIEGTQARTAQTLIMAGYEPDQVMEAVVTGNFKDLEHTGLIPTTPFPVEPNGGQESGAAALGSLGGRPTDGGEAGGDKPSSSQTPDRPDEE